MSFLNNKYQHKINIRLQLINRNNIALIKFNSYIAVR